MAPKFIGITGKKYAGKNTFAEMLANELALKHGKEVAITGFANPLKLSVYRLFTGDMNASEAQAVEWVDVYKGASQVRLAQDANVLEDGADDETLGTWRTHRQSFRQFLQRYGTESHRGTFGTDFWLEQTLDDQKWEKYDYVLIADVRFDNEAGGVLDSRGGFVIEVTGRETDDEDTHESEKGVIRDLIDRTVDNSGDKDQLRAAARVISNTLVAL